MNSRWFVFILCLAGAALIVWGFKSQPHTKSHVDVVQNVEESARAADETAPLAEGKGEIPSMNAPSATASSPAVQAQKEEPFMRHYPEDSPKKIEELRALFAPSENLTATLQLAKPVRAWKGPGVIDSGVYKLNDGGLASFRRYWQIDNGGKFTKESCYSLRLPGQPPVIGEFGDGTLTMLELPEPYSHIYVLRGIYFFMDVIEYSRWRAELREDQPAILNLYKKQSPTEIMRIGKWYRASIDGVPNSDAFEMSARAYCETVPEPKPD